MLAWGIINKKVFYIIKYLDISGECDMMLVALMKIIVT